MARQKREIYEVDKKDITDNIGGMQGNEAKFYFSTRLNEILKKKKITQDQLCKDTGISLGALSDYRNGKSEPRITNLRILADYIGVSCDYLLGIDEAPTREVSDVCKVIPLAPETVKVLKLSQYKKDLEERLEKVTGQPAPLDLEVKALNHIISNCNNILRQIGMYLFGDITGIEDFKIKNAAINIKQSDEFFRNGILHDITYTLKNYRAKLLENDGDLPLTAVLDETQKAIEEATNNAYVKSLEDCGNEN